MISLIVYGRNDQHGYNSHRRVTLSLNAMAEVLTGENDEILFVDYGTPRGMPTLPEAIEDTLTDRALRLMRVLRVTEGMHARATGGVSRLPISEPHARNAAARRANPGNWILSTNTDMVFVPRADRSLTDLVADLDGDAYGLPRFEIPEWLWESVPRTDPDQIISLLRDWGERAGLDEVTYGHDWILYDAPGDFQLLRRSLFEDIHGFDERMIHGWHVDSNLWKRVHNLTGEIRTLYPNIAGYHTNHNRTLTRLMEAQPTGNDLGEFVYGVDHSRLPHQADDWGFAEEHIVEVRLRRANPVPLLQAASSRAAGQEGPLLVSDTREQMTVLEYDARHVLPFALDPIIAAHPTPSVAYVGINTSTADMLRLALEALGCPGGLQHDVAGARDAEVVIIDLGIDGSTGRGPLTRSEADELITLVEDVLPVLREREGGVLILVIGAISGVWEEWARAFFRLAYGTFHTRVQPAELRVGPADIATPSRRSLRFITRDPDGPLRPPENGSGVEVSFRESDEFAGLDQGWASVDAEGVHLGSETGRLRFTGTWHAGAPVKASVDISCWSEGETAPDAIDVAITLDGAVLHDGPLAVVPQLTRVHACAEINPGSTHELMVKVNVPEGESYNPRLSGGRDPWLRFEGARVTAESHAPATGQAPDEMRMSPGSPLEAMLRGQWTKTNPFGAWSLASTCAVELPTGTSPAWLGLELLGHPDRKRQGVRLTVVGDATRVTDIDGLSAIEPAWHWLRLPAPRPDGTTAINFEALGKPAPTGEVVELRAMVLRTTRP